jgi:hypothetical protein
MGLLTTYASNAWQAMSYKLSTKRRENFAYLALSRIWPLS